MNPLPLGGLGVQTAATPVPPSHRRNTHEVLHPAQEVPFHPKQLQRGRGIHGELDLSADHREKCSQVWSSLQEGGGTVPEVGQC